MYFFLDVERRRVDDEFAPVLFILAAPDELGVKVAVAAFIGDAENLFEFLLLDGLIFGGGDVFAVIGLMGEGFDGLLDGGFLGHVCDPLLSAWLPRLVGLWSNPRLRVGLTRPDIPSG